MAGSGNFIRRAWHGVFRRSTGAVDRLLKVAGQRDLHDESDFIADADWAIAGQTPRGARLAIWISLGALVVLTIWAALAKIDEVTRGEGRVIPSSQNQVIQSLDGGMVKKILVREGQLVEKGQLLLEIDPTRFVSSLRENRAQYLALVAKATRLTAVAEDKPFVAPPEVQQAIPDIVEQERQLYQSKRAELDASVGIARQQLTQRQQEYAEVRARRDQASQSYDLTARELEVTRPLTKTGAVSDVELLRLERDVARFRGERDAANAQIPRIQAAIAEAQRKIQEVELQIKNQARAELSETTAKIGALSAGSEGLEDRVKQAEIRAPMRGTVKQLFVHTVGGVVQPGKEVIEVVPSDEDLLLEARVLPRDIAFLRPGQPALVKFTAYDFSIYGGLEGTLEHIGADTVVDEKGNAFYEVRVRTKAAALGAKHLPIIPGMVAEVDILTGKKSVLSYLLKPVLRAKGAAMTER